MKTLYTLFLFFFCFLHVLGQNNCEHNVSTNPSTPTNNALPVNSDSYRYLNEFDWNERDQNDYLSYYQLENMLYNQNMLNIMDNQSGGYYNYITQGEQMIFTRSQSSNPLFIAQPSLLLEKTEELTLYILQLEERLHKLETQE